MKTAVFPGSFDPITNGHLEIIQRAIVLFDEVIIAIGHNPSKKNLFGIEERIEWIRAAVPNVKVKSYSGLTTDFCKKEGAGFIVRGLRNSHDFEYEKNLCQLNSRLKGIETIFLISGTENAPISSSIVREIMLSGGDASSLVPQGFDWKHYIKAAR